MEKDEYLIIYEDCRVVEGYLNALIYDLTRPDNSNIIPKGVVTFIEECKNKPLNSILNQGNDEEKRIKQDYCDFLIKNDFGLLGDKHLKSHLNQLEFPRNLHPERIYDAVICVSDRNFKEALKLSIMLDEFTCQHIEFRIENLSKERVGLLMSKFKYSTIETIIIRIKYFDECIGLLQKILRDEMRVRKVFIYEGKKRQSLNQIEIFERSTDFIKDCGEIDGSNFSINTRFFTESQNCNSCLHKKISIDFDGTIKNCPSMTKSYGSVSGTDLNSLIKSTNFKEYGEIIKDNIEVCRDCYYRHMCLDCRAFTDSDNILSRPNKCGYNPYIEKWKGEEGYRTLEECGVISNENEFSIDHDTIAAINEELWGEE